MVLRYPGRVTRVLERQHLVTKWKSRRYFYGFDMDMVLKGLFRWVNIRKCGAVIPTYVRNDNSDAAYRVGSATTVTNDKRINGLLESKMGGLEQDGRVGDVYMRGDINTSDGLAEKPTYGGSGKLVIWKYVSDSYEINGGNMKKKPSSKHYIVYPETAQGQKDSDAGMRRKARRARWPVLANGARFSCPRNSFFVKILNALFYAKRIRAAKPILFFKKEHRMYLLNATERFSR